MCEQVSINTCICVTVKKKKSTENKVKGSENQSKYKGQNVKSQLAFFCC